MSPVVLAQHVTKWYGPRRAVTDVSFAIEPSAMGVGRGRLPSITERSEMAKAGRRDLHQHFAAPG